MRCASCGYDNPASMGDCPGCGAAQGETANHSLPSSTTDAYIPPWLRGVVPPADRVSGVACEEADAGGDKPIYTPPWMRDDWPQDAVVASPSSGGLPVPMRVSHMSGQSERRRLRLVWSAAITTLLALAVSGGYVVFPADSDMPATGQKTESIGAPEGATVSRTFDSPTSALSGTADQGAAAVSGDVLAMTSEADAPHDIAQIKAGISGVKPARRDKGRAASTHAARNIRSDWRAALRADLANCRNNAAFIKRIVCNEQAKWRHCAPKRWGTVPECPLVVASRNG